MRGTLSPREATYRGEGNRGGFLAPGTHQYIARCSDKHYCSRRNYEVAASVFQLPATRTRIFTIALRSLAYKFLQYICSL